MLLEYPDDYGTPHLTLRPFDWIDWLWHAVAEMQFIHQNHYKLQVGFKKTGRSWAILDPKNTWIPVTVYGSSQKIYNQDPLVLRWCCPHQFPGVDIFRIYF